MTIKLRLHTSGKVLQVTFGKPGAPLTRLDDTKTGFYALTDGIKTIDNCEKYYWKYI